MPRLIEKLQLEAHLGGENADEKLWNLLNPLQSMLVYSLCVSPDKLGGTFVCRRIRGGDHPRFASLPEEAAPVCLVFTSEFEDDPVLQAVSRYIGHIKLNYELAMYLLDTQVSHLARMKEQLGKHGKYNDGELDTIERVIRRSISSLVSLPAHQVRIATLTFWMCLLAQQLYGRIHEGEPLDFWFIAGDRTEFADDAQFRLRKLLRDCADKDNLRVPVTYELGGGVDSDKLEAAIRYLEKEHFPWFHRGRHALFFDISDQELRPIGLVELTNSSWRHVLDESYQPGSEQHLSIPACAIVYVDGETHDAGLLSCNPKEKDTDGPQIRHVMRFFKSRWLVTGTDEREKILLEHRSSIQ